MMTSPPVLVGLQPGWHLYPGPDEMWRLAAPDGAVTRISGPAPLLQRVASLSRPGLANLPDLAAGEEPVFAALCEALATRGALRTSPAAAFPGRVPRVQVEGHGPLAAHVAALLSSSSEARTGPIDEDAVAGCDAVVSCANWQTDTRWQQLDRWCHAHGTVLTTSHAEGDTYVIGPAGAPGRTASYRDARGRRLAAAPLPDELGLLWAHLDEHAADLPAAALSTAAKAVIAGLLVHEVHAALDEHPPAHGRQLVVSLRDLSVAAHPVLPLPTALAATTVTATSTVAASGAFPGTHAARPVPSFRAEQGTAR